MMLGFRWKYEGDDVKKRRNLIVCFVFRRTVFFSLSLWRTKSTSTRSRSSPASRLTWPPPTVTTPSSTYRTHSTTTSSFTVSSPMTRMSLRTTTSTSTHSPATSPKGRVRWVKKSSSRVLGYSDLTLKDCNQIQDKKLSKISTLQRILFLNWCGW